MSKIETAIKSIEAALYQWNLFGNNEVIAADILERLADDGFRIIPVSNTED